MILKVEHTYLDKAINFLKSGKIICFPTETVFALACDAKNPEAIEHIYDIKKRNHQQPLSVLVSDIETIEKFAILNEYDKKLAEKYWPGPLTLILDIKENNILAKNINIKDNTIGVRIPNHQVAFDICHQFGSPIIGTSANFSGMKEAISSLEVANTIGDLVDLIIDDGHNCSIGKSSTIIDNRSGYSKIIRSGCLILE